jgi:dihydrofolate reductase
MKLSIIVAVAKNNVIGKNNALIWHLPADMKFFKEKTSGHCIITGRKNYESIPEKYRPLINRTNIIVTHQKNYTAAGTIVVHTIEDALKEAESRKDDEVFIIGGAEIYKQTINNVNTIYVTQIDETFDGDVFFPEIDPLMWKLTETVPGIVNEKNTHAHSFMKYERIK